MSSLSGFLGSILGASSRASSASAESSIAYSTESSIGGTLRQQFVPMNGLQYTVDAEQRQELLWRLRGKETKLETRDGALLDAVWCPSVAVDVSPTVMIFHGNGCILDNMSEYAQWYKDRGLNVLLVTMRGYPGSTGDAAKAGELGFYLDAETCVRFALKMGVRRDRLFGHGYSLGGVLAASLQFFRLPMTLDHTLVSAQAIMKHIAHQSVALPEFITNGVARGTFRPGITDAISEDDRVPDSLPLVTDGLNSLEKLRKSDCSFFIMYGKNDTLMPVDFAKQFLEARCGVNPTEKDKREHLAEIPGGHWGPFMEHPDAIEQYEQYLLANNLMDPSAIQHVVQAFHLK